MAAHCIAAHTHPTGNYPAYINFTKNDDGSVDIHLRGEPPGDHHDTGPTAVMTLPWAEWQRLRQDLIKNG